MPRFKLLHGQHIENDANGKERRYRRGDVFESRDELDKKFDEFPGAMGPKFQRISREEYRPEDLSVEELESLLAKKRAQAAVAADDDNSKAAAAVFAECTMEELQAHAAEEEISLDGCTTREQVIGRLLQAQCEAAAASPALSAAHA